MYARCGLGCTALVTAARIAAAVGVVPIAIAVELAGGADVLENAGYESDAEAAARYPIEWHAGANVPAQIARRGGRDVGSQTESEGLTAHERDAGGSAEDRLGRLHFALHDVVR